MKHPRCVALGEIGLDYHYDNSPRDIQQSVFVRQLQIAVSFSNCTTPELQVLSLILIGKVIVGSWQSNKLLTSVFALF